MKNERKCSYFFSNQFFENIFKRNQTDLCHHIFRRDDNCHVRLAELKRVEHVVALFAFGNRRALTNVESIDRSAVGGRQFDQLFDENHADNVVSVRAAIHRNSRVTTINKVLHKRIINNSIF